MKGNEMGEMDTTMQDTVQHCSTLQNCTTPAAAWLQGTLTTHHTGTSHVLLQFTTR